MTSDELATPGPEPLSGRLVDGEMPPLPGGAVEVWHCGLRMAHQMSGMRWTVNRGSARPGAGTGGQLLTCTRCGARALVQLEVPVADWTPPQHAPGAGKTGLPPQWRAAARRAAVAEVRRRVAGQVAATADEHAVALADAALGALADLPW
ncbi:hypothetical protein [Nonomuraea sp. NPDC049646]|uniref:hypothetical protein n=1 Tax=unclassified Nonomuraea TaxID=2593643 RepID=UPI003793ED69